MGAAPYEYSVFLNCPFDEAYRPLFEALVFAVHDCGYIARCALEVSDAREVRIQKITKIIEGCRFGIHDISRTELVSLNGRREISAWRRSSGSKCPPRRLAAGFTRALRTVEDPAGMRAVPRKLTTSAGRAPESLPTDTWNHCIFR